MPTHDKMECETIQDIFDSEVLSTSEHIIFKALSDRMMSKAEEVQVVRDKDTLPIQVINEGLNSSFWGGAFTVLEQLSYVDDESPVQKKLKLFCVLKIDEGIRRSEINGTLNKKLRSS